MEEGGIYIISTQIRCRQRGEFRKAGGGCLDFHYLDPTGQQVQCVRVPEGFGRGAEFTSSVLCYMVSVVGQFKRSPFTIKGVGSIRNRVLSG